MQGVGICAQKRIKKESEYGRQLKEKQNLKKVYGISEGQLRRYVRMAQGMAGNAAENLLILLETRLDNVVFRAGFAHTRPQARQYATHGLFKLNGRRVDIPSIFLKQNDQIEPRKEEQFESIALDKNILWLAVDQKGKTVLVKRLPTRGEIDIPIDENTVIQFYSR